MPKHDQIQQPVRLSLEKVARVVKKARENLRYSYRDLSARCGVSSTQLRRLEQGDTAPSVENLFRISVALGVPLIDLLTFAAERTVEFPAVAFEYREVQSAIAWGEVNGLAAARSRKKLSAFFSIVFGMLVEVLSGVNVGVELIGHHTTSAQCNQALEGLQIHFDDFSNTERVSTLQTLLQSPYTKMRALRLVSAEILHEVIIAEGISERQGQGPASIARTIGFDEV